MRSFTQAALAELQRQDPTVSAIEIDQFHIQCRKSAWLAAYISTGSSFALLGCGASGSFFPSTFDECIVVISESGNNTLSNE